MSGATKHMVRSHRSYRNKDAAFKGFYTNAARNSHLKETKAHVGLLASILGMFRHQGK